ncbi:MAG: sigma-70 family polymerase sigma factor [Segetibacter sp.]|jgi:RNA polymerase sigma factor (sigma-70 family)|nr:sigma-70 family polymerase sigma factor [Segetibacter sp.]
MDNFTPIDSTLIKNCIAGNRKSQKKLYELLAPKMYPVCLKFFSRGADAEDVLQEGFIKLFNHLHSYRGEGSFEGWVRRIFVNTAIQYYRSLKPAAIDSDDIEDVLVCSDGSALDNLYAKDLICITRDLSEGYRNVFNLYAVEGYSHKEIAEILGITESTSKSQYLRAKASIRQVIGKRA